jgi:periplasmic divalent cation tolerance protein
MSGLVGGDKIRLVLTTCPDATTAEEIARELVEERLAACGNVVPGLTSIYRWKGAIERADEWLLLLKTTSDRLEALAARMRELHPYDVPEILTIEIARGDADYVRWVVEETHGHL